MSDWYRERPFKVAFAVSVVIHAGLIAFIPGFRSVPIESPRVLEVEIAPQEAPPIPRVQDKPVVPPKIVEPRIERVPEPPPAPRADIIPAPRAEPKPEFVVPKPELRPEPKAEPTLETRPEPIIEPQPEPPPIARFEPRPEPQPVREAPPPVVPPRVEPSIAAPPVVRPAPDPVATAPAPSAATPQPQPSAPKIDEVIENRLLATYGQSISKEIRRHQKYPPPAQRRRWEGTVEVLLQIAADGKVTGITLGKSSGHAILDEEALDMVRRASPLPQAPPDLRGRALVVSVPIVFRLQNS